jgi:hypothetical protein
MSDVSVSLLSIYYRLPAFSDTAWHESNHHLIPPSIINQSTQYSHYFLTYRYQEVIKKGDALLNQVQKLGRVVEM